MAWMKGQLFLQIAGIAQHWPVEVSDPACMLQSFRCLGSLHVVFELAKHCTMLVIIWVFCFDGHFEGSHLLAAAFSWSLLLGRGRAGFYHYDSMDAAKVQLNPKLDFSVFLWAVVLVRSTISILTHYKPHI